MSLTTDDVSQVIANLTEQVGVISESLSLAFDHKRTLVFGEAEPAGLMPDALRGPGLIVHLTVNESVFAIAIPATLPLPETYPDPDVTLKSRMETLAMEWSMSCLPPTLEASAFGTLAVESLWPALESCGFTSDTLLVPASIEGEAAQLWFLLPLVQTPMLPEPVSDDAGAGVFESSEPSSPPEPPRIARVFNLPVTVVVQLAAKRIEMKQLCSLAPGSLVQFEKSCEDLLDMYVNNRLFCRGEAVKVGEKFGLKINEVGPVDQRVSAVIDRHNRG